ncbi:hypothetical protein K1T71_014732 [Dendrolimus kikuchii]|nr:hypothetical protein K1T71_014732 [Dendrolimus kikuchii]
MRRSLGEVLDNMKNIEVNKAKAGFKGFIDRLSKSKQTTQTADFHNYVNSLYANKDKFFKRFINSFNQVLGRSKRTNMDLIRIIREGLRSIIFDHYSNLNVNARRELVVKIQALWKDIASNMNEKEWDFTYDNGDKELYIRESVNNKFSDDIMKNNYKDSERERNVREGQGSTDNRINEI